MKKLLPWALCLAIFAGLLAYAGAGQYDAYKPDYRQTNWHTKINEFIDQVSSLYTYAHDILGNAVASLSSLVTNWATTENYIIYCTATPTYSDGDTFTVPGDLTGSFPASRIIHAYCGVDGMKYSTVASSSYATGTTTVNLNTSVLTSNLAQIFFVAARDGLTMAQSGQVFAADYGSPGLTALQNAIAAIGVTNRTLVVGPGTWTISDDLEIPANIHVVPMSGAVFDIADTKTLTISGSMQAGRYQIYELNTSGAVDHNKSIPVFPEWFAGVPDFDVSAQTGTNNLAALTAAFQSGTIVDLGASKWGVSDTVAISTDAVIISNGGSIHRIKSADASCDEVLSVTGTVGSYSTLGSDAVEGSNRIECAALAGSVSRGTLLKITSNKKYNTTVGGATYLYAGEMQTVLMVSGNYIYLSHALEDSYAITDNARAAIVSPITLTVIGDLGIYCYPQTSTQLTRGVKLQYTIGDVGNFKFDGCTRHSLYVNSCYAPDITIYARNSYYYDADNAYGLSIGNSTMYGNFRGVITGCRHCVMTGGANADRGISYGNKFSGQVSGISEEQVLDSHAGTGSMTYENVIVNGGTANYNHTGGPYTAGGIEMGARRNYIRNVVYQGGRSAISTRTISPDIEILDVDGVQIIGPAAFAVLIGTTDSDTQIGRLSLRNIYGDSAVGIRITGATATPTTVGILEIENIKLNGNLLLYTGDSSRVLLPGVVVLRNCSITDTDNTDEAINIAAGGVEELILENFVSIGQSDLMTCTSELNALTLINCRSEKQSAGNHIIFENASLGRLIVSGGYFDTNAEDPLGIIRMDDVGETLGEIHITGSPVFADAQYVVSCKTGSPNAQLNGPAFIGAYYAPNLIVFSNVYGSGYAEYLAGSQSIPLVMRGSGSPQGVVTARIGSIYVDVAGGTGTTMYVKESGTGNTGWVAK